MAGKQQSAQTKIKKAAIDQMIGLFNEAPEKPKDEHTLKESVQLMQESIKGMLAKGYIYDEIAAMMAKGGISISGATLKQYMSDISKKGTFSSRKKPTTAKSKPADKGNVDNTEPEQNKADESASKPGSISSSAVTLKSSKAINNTDSGTQSNSDNDEEGMPEGFNDY
jgi:hypothetical protein